MAKKKSNSKERGQEVMMGALMAAGGGVASEVVADIAAKYFGDFIAENPKLGEALPAAVGLAGLYFVEDTKYDPIFYGMIGASAAGFADDIIQLSGFGRSKGRMNGTEADEYQKGIEYVERLQNEGFGAMNGHGRTRVINLAS